MRSIGTSVRSSGFVPVAEITTPMLAAIIESIRRRGARDTAAKVLWHCSSVFRLAQARGLCSANPAEPVKELLDRKKKTTPMPAVLDLPGLGEILGAPVRPVCRRPFTWLTVSARFPLRVSVMSLKRSGKSSTS